MPGWSCHRRNSLRRHVQVTRTHVMHLGPSSKILACCALWICLEPVAAMQCQVSSDACPSGWTAAGNSQKRCYRYLGASTFDRAAALAECQSIHPSATLPSMDSPEENNWFNNNRQGNTVWMGITAVDTSSFTFDDGTTPQEFAASTASVTNDDANKDCFVYGPNNNEVINAACSETHRTICQLCKAAPMPETSSAEDQGSGTSPPQTTPSPQTQTSRVCGSSTAACPSGWSTTGNADKRCYKYLGNAATYDKAGASAACVAEHAFATLPSLDHVEEKNWLNNNRQGMALWMGMSAQDSSAWTFDDGTQPASFSIDVTVINDEADKDCFVFGVPDGNRISDVECTSVQNVVCQLCRDWETFETPAQTSSVVYTDWWNLTETETDHCQCTMTWQDLRSLQRQGDVTIGGLGRLLETDRWEVWMCFGLENDSRCTCAQRDNPMCFVYHEGDHLFYPWGRNDKVKLLPELP